MSDRPKETGETRRPHHLANRLREITPLHQSSGSMEQKVHNVIDQALGDTSVFGYHRIESVAPLSKHPLYNKILNTLDRAIYDTTMKTKDSTKYKSYSGAKADFEKAQNLFREELKDKSPEDSEMIIDGYLNYN